MALAVQAGLRAIQVLMQEEANSLPGSSANRSVMSDMVIDIGTLAQLKPSTQANATCARGTPRCAATSVTRLTTLQSASAVAE